MIDIRGLVKANHLNKGRRNTRLRKIKPARPDYSVELWYKSQLLAIVKLLQATTEEILYPILKRTETQYAYTTDSVADEIADGLEKIAQRFGGIQETANRLASLAAQHTGAKADANLIKSVRAALGIDLTPILNASGISTEVAIATRANVNLIKSIPQKYLDRVATTVYENISKGHRYEYIIGDIQRAGSMSEKHAKFVARDQTAKMNAAITQARQQSIGITKYTWSTSNDERVRDSHAEKEGKVFSWNSPPEDTGHPGEDYQCRCIAVPFMELDLDAEEAALGLTW